jgi:hypothetical protein
LASFFFAFFLSQPSGIMVERASALDQEADLLHPWTVVTNQGAYRTGVIDANQYFAGTFRSAGRKQVGA